MTIQDQFMAFYNANPSVYIELVKLAKNFKDRGHRKIGIGMLWEVLRWQRAMATTDPNGDDWKLNNNFRSRYARAIMHNEPELTAFFEIRYLPSEEL